MQPGVDERLRYAELSRREADVRRRLDAAHLTRFRNLCEPLDPVDVTLSFAIGSAGAVEVRGRVCTRVAVACHRCAESVPWPLDSAFDVLVVASDTEASRLGSDHDVVVADGAEIAIGALVEDELILALPERACDRDDCERLPSFRYPGEGAGAGDENRPLRMIGSLERKQ